MKTLAYIGMTVLLSGMARGQSASPAFESADLRVSTAKGSPAMHGGTFHDGTFEMQSATLQDLIGIAYGVHDYNLAGAPAWLDRDRFDLTAHAPAATPPENVKLMLRTLLADRFKLAAHSAEKPMSVFVLTAGKAAPKMKSGDASGNAGCQLHQLPASTPGLVTDNMYVCHNMTMAAFASTLHGLATSYLTSPVVDFTGLNGSWDFDIAWTSKGSLQIVGGAGITVFDAVDKQLGLKLELQKRPLPILMIDHVEERLTGN